MISEDQLEQQALRWFQDTGWSHATGADIAPEGGDSTEHNPVWVGTGVGRLIEGRETSVNSVCSILETTVGHEVDGQLFEFSGTNAAKTHRFSL